MMAAVRPRPPAPTPRRRPAGVVARAVALAVIRAFVLATATVTVVAGCTQPTQPASWSGPPAPTASSTESSQASTEARPGTAPTRPYRVGVRSLTFTRSSNRVLKTTIWFPAQAQGNAAAAGRFPVLVFSHGLAALPTDYRALATRWAAAGFVVVAPAYPHTSRGAQRFDIADVLNQPADASYVLTRILALDRSATDPLRGHLDPERIAAAGHSAGAITTVGLFADGRDPRLDAGIVLAGNAIGMGKAFSGQPAAMLFVHGNKDPITPYDLGRATYDAVPKAWPKAFLTLSGERHIDPYLNPGTASFTTVAASTTDFLRWRLYGDAAAKARLAKGAGRANVFDLRL